MKIQCKFKEVFPQKALFIFFSLLAVLQIGVYLHMHTKGNLVRRQNTLGHNKINSFSVLSLLKKKSNTHNIYF